MSIFPRILAALCIALALLTAASCRKQGAGPHAPAKANPTFLHYFSGSLSGGVDGMVDAFNQVRPGIQLQAVALEHESFKTRVLKAVRAPNPPELLSYWAGARTASIAVHLEELDELWASAGLDGVFEPSLVADACVYEGRTLLLPITQHLVGFFYNKDLLGELGGKEPESWEEFLRLCASAKAFGIVPIALGAKDRWPAQFWYDYLLVRRAGPRQREEIVKGRLAFGSEPSKDAFREWKTLIDAGYFNAGAAEASWDGDAALMVRRGEALMTLMGSWLIGYYKGPDLDWEEGSGFGFFPFPQMDGAMERTALGPIDGIVVPKNAIAKDAAMEVLRYLAEAPAQEAFSRGSGALAPSRDVSSAIYGPIQEELLAEIGRCSRWAFNYDLAAEPGLAELGLNLFQSFLREPSRWEELCAEADLRRRAPSE